MPTPAKPKLSPAKLRKAYTVDLATAWAVARQKYPDHTPYAFVLYGVEGGEPPEFYPYVLTEESLTHVAQRYLDGGYHDTLDEARASLRYSVAASPFVKDLEQYTPTVGALVAPFASELDDETGYALLAKAAMAALKKLDAEGLFGTGAERERLLLVIITEDTPKNWSKDSARRLNPLSVFERFEKQTKIEGTFKSIEKLAIAPDGRSFFAAGSRRVEPGDDFVGEIIAYDIYGPRPVRRWTFEHPHVLDGVLGLIPEPERRSILVLRVQNNTTLLMRFAEDSGQPIQEMRLPDDPVRIALSADRSLIALATREGMIHMLDAGALKILKSRDLRVGLKDVLYLDKGVLLVATDAAVLQLDPSGIAPAVIAAPLRASKFAADEGNTLLAVSRRFAQPGPEYDAPPTEFGVHLLRLPTFEVLRTFLIPNHQAVTPALSHDGRLLAFEAHEIGKPRTFIVVFETATGREIARRRSDFIGALAFLPDDKTLVIARSTTTLGEPIDLWKVPDA